jgi:hypothetical protein
MVRKKQFGAKSAAIREMLQQNPSMPAKEIVSTLAGRGIKVTPNLVYALKGKAKSKGRKRAAQPASNGRTVSPVQLLLKVKELAANAGGIKHLKQLVDVLAE